MKPFLEGVRRQSTFPILLLLISLILASAALSDELSTALVVGVADGDAIIVLTPINKQIVIRLYGIDCPEQGQAFGTQAKEFTSGLCFGMTIQYRLLGIDRFDRTVATVFLEDGRELSLEILKAGFAWHYERYAKRQDYADAEEQARKTGIGLWADKDPTAPWEYRKNRHHES